MDRITSKFNVEALPRTETGVVDLSPDVLIVDAKRFQFKSGGDHYGVTERLQGVDIFDPQLCGIVLVWQSKEGDLFIADGHQRLGLARRAQDAGQTENLFLPSRIYKENDGFSAEDVMLIAAFKNIAEGTGSSIDVARIIKNHGDLPSTIPPKSVLVKQARALAKLGDNAFSAVCNGTLEPEYAAVAAEALDAGNLEGQAREQMEEAIMRAFFAPSTRPTSTVEASFIAKEVMRTGVSAPGGGTLRLFEDDAADNILKERAEILTTARNMLQNEMRHMKSMLRDETRINDYIEGVGTIDHTRVQNRHDILHVAKIMLDLGWKYGDINNPLATAARKLHSIKSLSDDHPEVNTFVTALDKSLTVNAHDLKSAKVKGDKSNGVITKIRAAYAKEFVRSIEAFLVESDLARTLQRSLGHQAQTAKPQERQLSF